MKTITIQLRDGTAMWFIETRFIVTSCALSFEFLASAGLSRLFSWHGDQACFSHSFKRERQPLGHAVSGYESCAKQLLEEDQLDESCERGRARVSHTIQSRIPSDTIRQPAFVSRAQAGVDSSWIPIRYASTNDRWWHDDDATRLCWTSLSPEMGLTDVAETCSVARERLAPVAEVKPD